MSNEVEKKKRVYESATITEVGNGFKVEYYCSTSGDRFDGLSRDELIWVFNTYQEAVAKVRTFFGSGEAE